MAVQVVLKAWDEWDARHDCNVVALHVRPPKLDDAVLEIAIQDAEDSGHNQLYVYVPDVNATNLRVLKRK